MLTPYSSSSSMLSLLYDGVFGRLARPPILVSQSLRLFSTSRVISPRGEANRIWFERKRQEDPQWYEQRLARDRQKFRDRRARDPEFVENQRRRQRKRTATAEVKARRRLPMLLWHWCTKKAWFHELPWKTHNPISYPQSIEYHCIGCGHTKNGGSRVSWIAHDNGHHLCCGCYAKRGWTDVMPTGYENCRSLKDIAARMQHLKGINPKRLP